MDTFPTKAECEIDPLFNIAVGVLVATQCSFIVCLMVYKKYELKRYEKCGDWWSIYIYSWITISLAYVSALWFYVSCLVLTIVAEQYSIKDDYA